MLSIGEGRIEVEDGFTIWYKVVGDGNGIPLLALHGGPGSGHDYLDSLEDLAVDRPVVFYGWAVGSSTGAGDLDMGQLAGVADRVNDVDPLVPHAQRDDGDDSLTDGDYDAWIAVHVHDVEGEVRPLPEGSYEYPGDVRGAFDGVEWCTGDKAA